jgi:molecular chaperone GrpE
MDEREKPRDDDALAADPRHRADERPLTVTSGHSNDPSGHSDDRTGHSDDPDRRDAIEELHRELEETRRKADEVRRQADEKEDRLLRALADADNMRRRAQRDRDEYVRYANESLLRDLIPVLDNLDRALDAARAAGGAAGVVQVVQGVELIQRELLRVLERAGVTRYSAVGQPFDPTRHEAVSRMIRSDVPPDTVAVETAPGYMLNDRVLRAALVVVAAAPDQDAA